MFEPLLSRFTSCWTCPIPPFEQAQSKRLRYSDEPSTQKQKLCRACRIMVLICQDLLLMEDILHQLGCVKPCKPFYKLPASSSSPDLAISSTVFKIFCMDVWPSTCNNFNSSPTFQHEWKLPRLTTSVVEYDSRKSPRNPKIKPFKRKILQTKLANFQVLGSMGSASSTDPTFVTYTPVI